MSWRVRNLVLSKTVGKTRAAGGTPCSANARKQVLASFADRANDDGSDCFVSKVRIAAENEQDRETVVKATRSLLEDGLLAIDDSKWPEGKRPCKEGFTYVYRVVISAIMALPDAFPARCRNSDTLDDALVEGDEPIGKHLGPVDKWAKRRRKAPVKPTPKVSELGGQDPRQTDTNYPSRTSYSSRATRPALDGRRAAGDPDYVADHRAQSDNPRPAPDPRVERQLRELRTQLAAMRSTGQSWNTRNLHGDEQRAAIAAEIVDIETRIARLEGAPGALP